MHAAASPTLTVYQAKCSAFLAWSQPFIYRLLRSLGPHLRQVVLTQRTENLDRFPMPVIEKLNTKTLFSPYHAHRAAARLQRKYDGRLIHAHFGYTALKMLLLKQLMRVPMVVTFGGRDLSVHAARPATQEVYRHLFEVCEQMVAVSNDLRRRAIEIGCPPEKIITVHRGVDLEEFRFVGRDDHDPGQVDILMVSRLVGKKGHADAAAALARLPGDVPDWRLTIIGEGPEEVPLRAQLRQAGLLGRARFLGVVPIEKVHDEMVAADVLLHPSVTGEDGDREGIPNVLMEGHATGLPVVATRHGGIPEVTPEGRSGLLVPEHDVAGLAAALERFLQNRELRLQFGRAGADHIAREFSLARQAERYLEIYRGLIDRYPPDHPDLVSIRSSAPLIDMLRKARAEAGTEGDLSLSEMFENLFIDADGDSDLAEPWWYSAFWRLKRYVPRGLKFWIKSVLYRRFRSLFDTSKMSAKERDDKVWKALQKSGIPDPKDSARKLADFEAILDEHEEDAEGAGN